ncbi:hypothetical protein FJ959_09780 [Mesorhizobium sp. B2-2-4]|uniref:head-tail connector protein n=1 Tax=unclassified Mesorhizobium TaxID=325217 RepID=UPI0011260CFD|nr:MULTISPECIES: hypothetical protein [unclassified Mesorhizobium]TPM59148.1 hypothetical protein FJ959_09780 [Mesorhizobium sp. B2-2-4]TPM67633.1 hypothetical protein FJ965_10920 [Mesorhizobium sp. B2-2-1]TPN66915.1 hypothetical protein FJ984_15785 [Mesorhizobium sp. B1-1-3]
MLIRKTIPEGLVISVADFKNRIRFEGAPDEEKDDIERIIRSATTRYETRTRRTMLPTEFEWRAPGWSCIEIPVVPIRSEFVVVYLDPAGTEQTLDPSQWQAHVNEDRGARIEFNGSSFARPALSTTTWLPVRVRFSAGYDDPEQSGSGDDPALSQNPMDIQAIFMLAAHWYANRATASDKPITSVPAGFEELSDERRIYG